MFPDPQFPLVQAFTITHQSGHQDPIRTMKTFHIAFAVATTAALCSAQSIKPGAKYTNRELAAMTPPVVNTLPGVPLVGGSDNCATPDVISGLGNFAYDDTTATSSSPAIPSNCATPTLDVWFVWTAPMSGTATMTLCGHTTADTAIAIYNGSTCPVVTSIGCNDDSCGAASLATFLCVAGNPYMLRVGMFSGSPGVAASFDLSIAPTPPPTNDNCATPTAISGVGNFAANMASATTSNVLPACQFVPVDHDVWYDWTAPATGNATVTLCSHTAADTVLAVYAGGGVCPAGSSIACDDDFCAFASSSQLTLPVTVGTHYTIQVGMFNGGAGVNTTFDITMPPPSNDDCATAISLAGPGVYPYDATLATTGSQGQTESACLFFSSTTVAKDLWYTYTASTNGMATFSTCGTLLSSNKDTKIAVYPGAGCPSAPAIVCKDDDSTACASSGLSTTVTWAVTCGTQYTLQLGQYPGNLTPVFGSFTLSETGTGCLTAPTEFCFGGPTSCPCGNAGAANNGCANSSVPAGAHLSATGLNSISADTLLLSGSGMPATSTALYFQGTVAVSNPFGDGINCAGGNQLRLGTKTNVAGASSYPGMADMSVSTRGGAVAGSNLNYQVVYRDAANFCTSSTFNTTNAINVVWAP